MFLQLFFSCGPKKVRCCMPPCGFGVRLLVAVLSCALCDPSMLPAQEASTRGYLDRIKLIRKNIDAEGVHKLMADIDADWGEKRDAGYYYVIRELCGAVSSVPALDPNRTNLVRKLATTALDAPGEKSVFSEVPLLFFLQGDPDYKRKLAGADWEKERLVRVHRWLVTWQHLRQAMSKTPAVVEPFAINVMPPSGGNELTYAGMDPAEIKDPLIRKQYEEAIAKNNEKARIYRLKRDLEDLDLGFVKPATRYVTEAYCKAPYRTEELEKSLHEYGVEKTIRDSIMAEVRKRVAEQIDDEAMTPNAAPKVEITEIEPPGTGPHHADPRLRKLVSLDLPSPVVENILGKLREATGVELSRARDIQNEYWATGSVSYVGIPAWQVMDDLAAYERVEGRWEADGTGYRLVRNGNPVVIPEESADSHLWRNILIAGAAFLAIASALIFMRRRAKLASKKE